MKSEHAESPAWAFRLRTAVIGAVIIYLMGADGAATPLAMACANER
jgi:hypothetical protein